jgi:hypothetical protein
MLNFERQLITPAVAEKYLEANIFNRRPKTPVVLRYVNDMLAGRWKEDTGETIKISKSGVILDGQQRLMAVKLANTAIYFHVTTNIEDSVFDVLDTGSIRNATDMFKIKGIKQDSTIPSIIAMYNFLLAGKRAGVQKNHKATSAVLLEQYYLDELLWQNVAKQAHAWYMSFAKIIPPSFIGGFYVFFLKLNEEKATDFMTQLATGLGVTNDAVLLLRNKLMQDKMSARKMPQTLKLALMIKAWNYFVKNQPIKILKFDWLRDDFPTALSR